MYNSIFPVWIVFLQPIEWIKILPLTFLLDSLILILGIKYLKKKNIINIYKKTILKIWLLGFLAKLMGTSILFATYFIPGNWWYNNITAPISTNPFTNIFGLLFSIFALVVAGLLIYIFNLKLSFHKLKISLKEKIKLAFILAIFTMPYVFLIPTYWIFRF